MDALQTGDVPYGNDWDSLAETSAYAESSDRARPWRSLVRDRFAERIAALPHGARVLELGSGPGLLAQRVLEHCPHVGTYTLLDFSEAMLEESRQRLIAYPAASFVCASFKDPAWVTRVGGGYHCVVSMQAVHELRHKRHAVALYRQAHGILAASGRILVCDHLPFDDTPKSVALYMTAEEQERALSDAGFEDVGVDFELKGLVLYSGIKGSS